MPRLSGKIIITTGGTQGVGEAIALKAAEEGAEGVVLCGRQQDKGAAVAARISAMGCKAEYVPADLAIVDDCRRVVGCCDEIFGRVDGLVNAAADTHRGDIENTTVEFWDHQFAVNTRAPFLLIQECVRIMKRETIAGSIVNIQSVAAYCGLPFLLSYSATKGALVTLTKNLANTLRQDQIRVNGVNLGWTDTPGEKVVQKQQGSPDDWLQQGEAASPFGRILKPHDVANLCVFLLSDESGIMTGANVDLAQRVIGVFPPEPSADEVSGWANVSGGVLPIDGLPG